MENNKKSIFEKNTRWYNIDFLKFLFSLIIVFYHILHSNIMNYVGNNMNYIAWQKTNSDAGIIVEMFLIISGFFLYMSIKNNIDMDIGEFVLSKIFRLWPVLFLSILLSTVFDGKFSWNLFLNAFFLQCIGVSLEYSGITWYISPFFWSLIFYFVLLKTIGNKISNIIIPLIVYFSFVINLNYMGGGFGRETIAYGISLGLLRCLAGIGLGYLLAKIMNYLYSTKYIDFFKIKSKIIEKTVFSLVEICTLGFIVRYTVFEKLNYSNKFVFVIMFCMLFISFVQKKGIVSDAFEIIGKYGLGRYSYSIYVMQQFSFDILKRTLWLKAGLIEREIVCIFVSVIFSVGVGIMVYYLVERPFVRLFKRKMKAIRYS